MLQLLLLLFGLSCDSFLAGALDGSFTIFPDRTIRVPVLFGICDGMALWIGLRWTLVPGIVRVGTELSDLLLLGVVLLFVLSLVRHQQNKDSVFRGYFLYLLPVGLSIDNLVAGPLSSRLSTAPWLGAVLSAIISGLLYLAGRLCGAYARLWTQRLRTARPLNLRYALLQFWSRRTLPPR